MITKTRQVVNAIGKTGAVFNDKLADGRRSLKVWGWTHADYVLAANKLREMGCTVKIVAVQRRIKKMFLSRRVTRLSRRVTRLHVWE